MIAADSRYASSAQLAYVSPAGEQVVYIAPRILPWPESFEPVGRHNVTDSDRLDQLAWKNMGNPTLSWRIADANRAMHPGALPGEPGDVVAIPVAGTISVVA
ncbi:MAG: hypothetical protein QOJ27_652 [Sphingomonadales bacterium]|nr:hypothetical protein [Sphingomonadales bacterium]